MSAYAWLIACLLVVAAASSEVMAGSSVLVLVREARERVRRKEGRLGIENCVRRVVGEVGDVVVEELGCSGLVVTERVEEDERRGECGCCSSEDDTGASSLAMRASMKVMNVKATL